MYLCYPVEAPDSDTPLMAMRGNFETNIAALKEIGYNWIELLVRDPAVLEKTDYAAVLEHHEMRVAAISTAPVQKQDGLTLLDDDSENAIIAQQRILQLITIAARWSCPVLIGKVRGNTAHRSGQYMSDLVKILNNICRVAGSQGVKILIEPQNETNINNLNSMKQVVEFIEKVQQDSIGIQPDTYHMKITEQNMITELKNAADKIHFIHVADSERQQPGMGEINFDEWIAALKDMGYDGGMSPEIRQNPDSIQAASDFFTIMNSRYQLA